MLSYFGTNDEVFPPDGTPQARNPVPKMLPMLFVFYNLFARDVHSPWKNSSDCPHNISQSGSVWDSLSEDPQKREGACAPAVGVAEYVHTSHSFAPIIYSQVKMSREQHTVCATIAANDDEARMVPAG